MKEMKERIFFSLEDDESIRSAAIIVERAEEELRYVRGLRDTGPRVSGLLEASGLTNDSILKMYKDMDEKEDYLKDLIFKTKQVLSNF